MQLVNGKLRVSASDLVAFSRCSYVTHLDTRVARGELAKPQRDDALLELLRSKGAAHETSYLDALTRQGVIVADGEDDGVSPEDDPEGALRHNVRRTLEAMGEGHQVIYQATFVDDSADQPVEWRGHVDFLRLEQSEDLGDQNWVPEDTKLAGKVSVNAVIQLLNYAEHVSRVTGKRPVRIAIVHGRGAVEFARSVFEVADLDAYYRALKRDFVKELTQSSDPYPMPVTHCQVCRWKEYCEKRWKDDDHLSQVAFMTTQQVKRLNKAGVHTMYGLSELAPNTRVPGISPEVVERLTTQARLQVSSAGKAVPDFEIVKSVEAGMGLWGLPVPDAGDMFYDIEGDPYVGSQGLEYLHGIGTVESGSFEFAHHWIDGLAEEKAFFEYFIDHIWQRRKKYPGLHVYHYAPYETTALKRLAGKHATRIDELDQLLREERFVDLYRIVRQGVRVGSPSYSIKKLEPLYMAARDTILDGSLSVIRYEEWLMTGDPAIKKSLIDYNKDDVESTWLLRDWLEARRSELVLSGIDLGRPKIVDPSDGTLKPIRQEARRLGDLLRRSVQ